MYLCLINTIDRERSTLNTLGSCVYFAANVGKLLTVYYLNCFNGTYDGHQYSI